MHPGLLDQGDFVSLRRVMADDLVEDTVVQSFKKQHWLSLIPV